MKFIVAGFLGANKALEPKLLPGGGMESPVGAESINQKPGRGDLRPWKVPLTVATVPSSRKTIYRMGRDVLNDALYWLSWTTVVHAIRGFIASDTTERTYFTGDGVPKVTDNTIGLTGTPYPTSSRILGIPAATTPMTVTLDTAGATGDDIEFFFTQTFVTDRGEESKPGPITTFTEKIDAVVDISDLEAAPAGNYGITLRRIYMTVPGQGNDGDFFLLVEQAVAGSTANNVSLDTTSAVTLQSNGPFGTTGRAWDVPPSDLKQLTAMWDGMMAGISRRSVRYCEPYRPHAWPVRYETLPPDVTPVALCVWDKNLLILTNGRPYLVTGSHPTNLGDDPVSFKQSCVSERSPVALKQGAAWAAPDGLAYYGTDKYGIVTEGLMTREDWQALKPETIIGTQHEGRYVGLYDLGSSVLKGFMIDPTNPTGVFFLDTGYAAAFFDELNDTLYVLDGTNVKKWDAGASMMTATFKSKVFHTARPTNMGWLEVTATTYPVDVTVTAKWYDSTGTLRTNTETRSVPSSNPISLKAGFLADQWQIEVSTAGAVQGIVLAETMAELRAT